MSSSEFTFLLHNNIHVPVRCIEYALALPSFSSLKKYLKNVDI